MSKRYLPWDREVLVALDERQRDTSRHPYTCSVHGTLALVPTYSGLVCPDEVCDYKQEWAHLEDTIDTVRLP